MEDGCVPGAGGEDSASLMTQQRGSSGDSGTGRRTARVDLQLEMKNTAGGRASERAGGGVLPPASRLMYNSREHTLTRYTTLPTTYLRVRG